MQWDITKIDTTYECLGSVVRWCRGAMVPWCRGALVPVCHGATVPWCRGALMPVCHGATVPWCRGALAFIQCMQHTRSSGQPLLPINPEPQHIGRMEAQVEIERMASHQEQARLAALAAAQVQQQNIDNHMRATNPDDEDLGDDELLNPRNDAEITTPANRRGRQVQFRYGHQPMQPAFDDDDDLDGAGAIGAIIPPPLAPRASSTSQAP
ncbi:hypothetical protein CQW23_30854 [Capsicum baccatum]|uniref:Uncharacterized protein n=1 Tax=Capsicum baccatum TaxID=33114 RepID=A0A2G2V9B5_CAPBA|nr:hypothetical protein CQW23_30854 [Capsicum baccatum]